MNTSQITLLIVASLTIFILMSSCKSTVIGSSERGVIFKRFDGGIDTSQVYLPGKYRISKHNRLIIYNIDSKSGKEYVNISTKDNIEINLIIAYTYKPIPEKVPLLEYYIGKNYDISIIKKGISNASKEYFKDKLSTEISSIGNQKKKKTFFILPKKIFRKDTLN